MSIATRIFLYFHINKYLERDRQVHHGPKTNFNSEAGTPTYKFTRR